MKTCLHLLPALTGLLLALPLFGATDSIPAPAATATIHLYRLPMEWGLRNRFIVRTNHGHETRLKHGQRLTLEVPAGITSLQVVFGMNRQDRQSFTAEAGQTYYFVTTTEARAWAYRPVLLETTEAGFFRQIHD